MLRENSNTKKEKKRNGLIKEADVLVATSIADPDNYLHASLLYLKAEDMEGLRKCVPYLTGSLDSYKTALTILERLALGDEGIEEEHKGIVGTLVDNAFEDQKRLLVEYGPGNKKGILNLFTGNPIKDQDIIFVYNLAQECGLAGISGEEDQQKAIIKHFFDKGSTEVAEVLSERYGWCGFVDKLKKSRIVIPREHNLELTPEEHEKYQSMGDEALEKGDIEEAFEHYKSLGRDFVYQKYDEIMETSRDMTVKKAEKTANAAYVLLTPERCIMLGDSKFMDALEKKNGNGELVLPDEKDDTKTTVEEISTLEDDFGQAMGLYSKAGELADFFDGRDNGVKNKSGINERIGNLFFEAGSPVAAMDAYKEAGEEFYEARSRELEDMFFEDLDIKALCGIVHYYKGVLDEKEFREKVAEILMNKAYDGYDYSTVFPKSVIENSDRELNERDYREWAMAVLKGTNLLSEDDCYHVINSMIANIEDYEDGTEVADFIAGVGDDFVEDMTIKCGIKGQYSDSETAQKYQAVSDGLIYHTLIIEESKRKAREYEIEEIRNSLQRISDSAAYFAPQQPVFERSFEQRIDDLANLMELLSQPDLIFDETIH